MSITATRRSAPQAPGWHTLWRPGIGMAIWLDTDAELPEGLAQLLAGKRFRRDIGMIAATGRREFVAAITLGTSSAVAALDASRSTPVAGDVRWYRMMLDGVRRFVAAGSVCLLYTSDAADE